MISKAPEGDRQPPHSGQQLMRLRWGRRVGRDQGQGQRHWAGGGGGVGTQRVIRPKRPMCSKHRLLHS